MRTLNDREKDIIRYLVNIENLREYAIVKLIDEYVNVCVIAWDSQYKSISIYSKENRHAIEDSYNKLLELIFLLDYLRSNMYISIYSLTGERTNAIYDRKKYRFDETKEFVEEISPNDKVDAISPSTLVVNTDIGKIISLYAQSAFYVSGNLREFVRNNFKSDEQLRFEEQMNDTKMKHDQAMNTAKNTLYWTRGAFVVAFISTIVTFIIGTCESLSQKDLTIRELNNTLINKKIPDIINAKLTNDTIKALIVSQPEKLR